ncbi:MAG: DUF1549 domain-containing protein, partial [Planctomycetia bacterium]|nr:DUF1549 domain-containing protein [Planctomycetia bacterium]
MTRNWRLWCVGFVGLCSLVVAISSRARSLVADDRLRKAVDRKIDFVKEVQPIFAAKCDSCHGAKKQESAYRLDHKATAFKGGDIGPAILPDKSAESPLIRYVAGLDADIKMPPEGDRLSSEQIAVLRAWIDQGADWPESASVNLKHKNADHWAFKTPTRPTLPKPKQADRARTAIDNFILAKLESEGLTPSPETDRITWLRRLSLDLIGLPPTADEVDLFVADSSADAFEKRVERLLASPHYGERWGRHWLDAARYADSDGFEKDKSRQVWFYRDWVVDAFNRDLPYDQFLTEQLAGDLLPNATQDQLVATGFLRHSMLNEEGGVDPEQFRMDAMFDRMEAIGKAMLGLTIQCAQCHNHKYDPLTQEEYYRLFAFLNNDHEAQPVVYTAEEQSQIAAIKREINAAEVELLRRMPDWSPRLAEWETQTNSTRERGVSGNEHDVSNNASANPSLARRASEIDWTTLQLKHVGDNGQRYFNQEDGSVLVAGYAPTKFTAHFASQPLSQKELSGIRLELLNDPNLPCNGPGRSFKGTCALTEITVEAENAAKPGEKVAVKLAKSTADYSNPERVLEPNFFDKTDKRRVTGPIDFAIDGKDDTAWGIDAGPGRRNQPRKAVFAFEKPVSFEGGTILHVYFKQMHGGWNSDDHMNNNLGRFRVSATTASEPVADPLPAVVRATLSIAREKRTAEQKAALLSYWLTTFAEFQSANDRIENLWQQWPTGSTQLALMPREQPRDTRVLMRGDFLKPSKSVKPGFPEFLNVGDVSNV